MAVPVIVVRILCGTARGGSGCTSTTNEQHSHAGCGQQPEGLLQRVQSAAMLALSPIPFRVAGGAVDQTFPKDGLIHGGARHCCPHSVWHGARRKWMHIHDQRATQPRWMRAATFKGFFSESRAQRCLP